MSVSVPFGITTLSGSLPPFLPRSICETLTVAMAAVSSSLSWVPSATLSVCVSLSAVLKVLCVDTKTDQCKKENPVSCKSNLNMFESLKVELAS